MSRWSKKADLIGINNDIQYWISSRGGIYPSELLTLLSDLDWCIKNGSSVTKETENEEM